MNVAIERVTLIGTECFVDFSSELGSAKGVWTAAAPNIGEHFDVELEAMDEVVWSVNARRAPSEIYSIAMVDKFIKLTARMVSISADGVAAVDVDGSVVLPQVIGFPAGLSRFIDLKFERVALFTSGV